MSFNYVILVIAANGEHTHWKIVNIFFWINFLTLEYGTQVIKMKKIFCQNFHGK